MSTETLPVVATRADAPPDDVDPSFDLAEGQYTSFAITPQSRPDDVAAVIDRVAMVKERMKQLNDWLDKAVTEWVNTNGPLTSGPFKWYVGDVSEVEWIDVAGGAEAGLIAANGDWSAFVRDFLVSKPVKHGALEQAIGAKAAAKFFRRVKVEELRDNVLTVKRKLQKTNQDFITRRR